LTTKERFNKVIEYFLLHSPDAGTELIYKNAYELLVAVILSAQCTDKRVNQITTLFFEKFPDINLLANAKFDDVYEIIKSCSYPNNKTKNLIGMAKTLIEYFDGKIPDDIEKLQTLPGVGRKTANVIASVYFSKPAMAVDTHVFRVSERIGFTTNSKSPFQTEMRLLKFIPENLISKAHHWLILHGRYVCKARKPLCFECGINSYCRYYEKQSSNLVNSFVGALSRQYNSNQ